MPARKFIALVEAPGIESPATSGPIVANRSEQDADRAAPGDATRPQVSASATEPPDTDTAIRAAAKVAIDAGDYCRARALLDLVDAKPSAPLTLASRKQPA